MVMANTAQWHARSILWGSVGRYSCCAICCCRISAGFRSSKSRCRGLAQTRCPPGSSDWRKQALSSDGFTRSIRLAPNTSSPPRVVSLGRSSKRCAAGESNTPSRPPSDTERCSRSATLKTLAPRQNEALGQSGKAQNEQMTSALPPKSGQPICASESVHALAQDLISDQFHVERDDDRG